MSFCSLLKGITSEICRFCLVLINSVLLNLSCVLSKMLCLDNNNPFVVLFVVWSCEPILYGCFYAPYTHFSFIDSTDSDHTLPGKNYWCWLGMFVKGNFMVLGTVIGCCWLVHRNRRFVRDGNPGRPPRLSHSS